MSMPDQTNPIQVEVVNHPQPKKYLIRSSYRTVQLSLAVPVVQIATYDPLRVRIRFSNTIKGYVICGSLSQAQDPANSLGPATAVPNGRYVYGTSQAANGEAITEGQSEVWLTGGVGDFPFVVGYEIVREVPE